MKKGAITVVSTLLGAAAGASVAYGLENKKVKRGKELDKKNDAILQVMSQWLLLKQEGKNLSDYFLENGYKRIAVYGMHYLGEALLKELENSEVEVVYAIDKRADGIYCDVNVVTPEDELEEVDVVVVTAFFFFDEIEELLSTKIDCPIISIEDAIYG